MKRLPILHPFLFALWPVLFVYAENLGFVRFSQAWTSIFVLLGLALLMFGLFFLILRQAMQAAAITSLFLILFFSYVPIHNALWGQGEGYAVTKEAVALMVAWAILFAGGTALILRVKDAWRDVTRVLNFVALVLVMLSLFKIGLYEVKASPAPQAASAELGQLTTAVAVPADKLPNIYYIIVDAYGRSDVLQEVYGYDNSAFLDFLREKGFFVAEASRANYAQTDLSLASSLNLSYLDDLAAQVGTGSTDRRPLASRIQNSAVTHFLQQQGYTIVGLPSGYDATTLKQAGAYPGSARPWNELEVRLLCNTPILWLNVAGNLYDPYAIHRQKILNVLDLLPQTADLPAPRFVFAHILAPHGPFVFDEEGNDIAPQRQFDLGEGARAHEDEALGDAYRQGYVGQLVYINRRLVPILDGLAADQFRPTIVILQADHGPESLVNWDDPDLPGFKERLAILNAYLVPAELTPVLYDEITPVNTFRLILNAYFGTDLELLEDASYFSTWTSPYRFVDVTEQVR